MQNGKARLIAKKRLPELGTFEKKLTPEEMKAISDKAQEIEFNKMKRSYDMKVTCIPSTTISIKVGD